MYSIWNPSGQAQDLLATFELGKGQTYLYPMHVPASGTAMIDVKEIAQMGMPDVNGNTLPVPVTRGRLSISAASGKPIDPINVVVSGGIYNPTKATCGYTCETCNGCTSFYLSPNPFDGTVSVLAQEYAQCPWTTGNIVDYTYSSAWSSGDTSIITVETEGDSQPGLSNPVDVGNTDLMAQISSAPVSMGQICASPPLPNCQYTQASPQAPATSSAIKVYVSGVSLSAGTMSKSNNAGIIATVSIAFNQTLAAKLSSVHTLTVSLQTWSASPAANNVGYTAVEGTIVMIGPASSSPATIDFKVTPNNNTVAGSVVMYAAATANDSTFSVQASPGTPPNATNDATLTITAP